MDENTEDKQMSGYKNTKIKVIIATHKNYRMPADDLYVPLHVGAEVNPVDLGYLKDNTGDNISDRNPSFCELTGLYWAWKNLDADYLGLAHYRRHFMLKKKSTDPFENVLTLRQCRKVLQRYRIIVPRKRNYYIESLYSHYAHTHYAEHLDVTRTIIESKCPGFLGSFDRVMARKWGFMFNMMIMERQLVDDYCSWLFDILFELEERIGGMAAEDLGFYQGRFYGRVSELLFNVWLERQIDAGAITREDVIELPCIYMEKINWWKKGTSFLRAKFFGKKYEGSF